MFGNHYEVVVADEEYARYQHHFVRYQVYCLETGYECADRFPQRQEVDSHDVHALPFVVNAIRSGEPVAAMRLIFGDCRELPTVQAFPNIGEMLAADSGNVTVEISRMSVLGSHRGTLSSLNPGGKGDDFETALADRRTQPAILIGLLRAAYWYSRTNGITHWVFMAAPSLVRLLKYLGFSMSQVGPVVDFKGMRAPHVCDMETFAAKLETRSPEIYRMFNAGPYYSFASESLRARAIA